MIRSELVDAIAATRPHLRRAEVELVVAAIFDAIVDALIEGRRVELRGFGAFSARSRAARTARNPRTGAPVVVPPKRVLHFHAGKELRARLNSGTSLS